MLPADWLPRSASVGELADRPWVAGPAGTACGRALERVSAAHGFTPHRAHTALEFPTVPALVAAGLGAAIVPTLALAGPRTDSVALPALPAAGHRRIAALRRPSPSGADPLTDAVVAALREAAQSAGLRRSGPATNPEDTITA
ncbi:LysR substrate-binding domain-containing protein [Kitasatospora sp. NPDC002227]|uniref:LysR substrate-binding domain-containing protein n=1 Tax=Kitasatospora sp. NPDC002227 TaxID=3154773 RepID=UPI0033281070